MLHRRDSKVQRGQVTGPGHKAEGPGQHQKPQAWHSRAGGTAAVMGVESAVGTRKRPDTQTEAQSSWDSRSNTYILITSLSSPVPGKRLTPSYG